MEDLQLLREYAERQSEPAFTELVNRHVNFVYSTALRVVNDPQLAEDIAQLVFIQLARKARSLDAKTILTGWLYRTTQYTAQTALRSECRRRKREKLAMENSEMRDNGESTWKEIAPLLETAMARLRQRDQDALLLRFFSGKTVRETGETLGISDDAAQKRVDRAIEKLRVIFARQGVAVSAATLVPVISTHAIQAAPANLAATFVSASLGGVHASLTTTASSILKAIALAKFKTVAAGAAAALAVLTAGTFFALKTLGQSPVAAGAVQPASLPEFVVRGTIRTPDGKPLAGALVRLAYPGGLVRLYDTNAFPTNIPARVSRIATNTSADGSFRFALPKSPPEGKAVVAVNDDAGYAVATATELARNPEIVVEPWGRIEGVLHIGKTLGTNHQINLNIWGMSEVYEWYLVSHDLSVKTDANGHFAFPRVAPTDIWLTHTVIIRPGEGRQSGHRYVHVGPGQHINLELGGKGRAVIGRIEWDSPAKLDFYGTLWAQEKHNMRNPPGWREMSLEEKRQYCREWRASPESEPYKEEVRNVEFPVSTNGTFWVDDVLPGRYRMQVRADAKVPRGQPSRLAAKAEVHVDVPDLGNDPDAPIDLGTLYPQP